MAGTTLPRVGRFGRSFSQCVSLVCFGLMPVTLGTNQPGGASYVQPVNPTQRTEQESKGSTSPSGAESSLRVLKKLAAEQITTDPEFLGQTRFSIDQQKHSLFYDPRSLPSNVVLSDTDPYARILEALIRVQALRRDFAASIPDDKFWLAPLQSIEQTVQRCILDIDASQSRNIPPANEAACSKHIDEQFDALKPLILGYAGTHGLEIVPPPGSRGFGNGYRVQIKVDPPRARVRLMTLLEFKKYQYFKTPSGQYQWNDILDADNDLIGWYHYRVEWPADLNGPEEGDIEIKKPGVLTFRPTQK